jgi:hypothetical protein
MRRTPSLVEWLGHSRSMFRRRLRGTFDQRHNLQALDSGILTRPSVRYLPLNLCVARTDRESWPTIHHDSQLEGSTASIYPFRLSNSLRTTSAMAAEVRARIPNLSALLKALGAISLRHMAASTSLSRLPQACASIG